MLAALGVREVRAIVLVDGQTESALEAADVVLEEVRVLVEIDGLERELPQTLATVGVGRGGGCDTTATELGSCAILQ